VSSIRDHTGSLHSAAHARVKPIGYAMNVRMVSKEIAQHRLACECRNDLSRVGVCITIREFALRRAIL
jgi:hypothetical protein